MSIKLIALRVVALLGLGVSAASLVDHLRPEPFFCGFESGCEQVVRSPFGRVAGVPLPWLGIAAFGLFLAVSLFPAHPVGKLLGPMAVLSGVAGLALLLIQALALEQFCQLCLVADASAMTLALIQLAIPEPAERAPGRPWRWLWAGLAAVALAAPWAADWLSPSPPVPEPVKALWVSGKVNVVVVTDFECEACGLTHPELNKVLEGRADIHLVRLVHPLAKHKNARHAARAFWYAQSQGKGPAMYEALFASPDVTPASCEKLVAQLGLDVAKYRAAIADPSSMDRQIDEATAWAPKVGAKGLPLIWVQDRGLFGLQTEPALRAALTRATPAP